MTMTFVGTGGVFTRLGLWFGEELNVLKRLGKSAPTPSSLWGASGPTIDSDLAAANLIEAQYQSTLQNVFDGTYQALATYQQASATWLSFLNSEAGQTMITQANNDTPLTNLNLQSAVALLITQLNASSYTVTKNTTSVSVSATSGNHTTNTCTSSIVGSNGLNQEYVYAETLTLKVTNDQWHGGTAGSEPWSISGQVADNAGPNPPLTTGPQGAFDWQWPLGSGAFAAGIVVDPNLNQQGSTGGNLLNNSAFATGSWTGSVPNQWSAAVGAGQISKDTSNTFGVATADVEFAGDGSTLTTLSQQFNNSGGTTTVLTGDTVYAVHAVIKLSATASGGVLAMELATANTGGSIIQDDNGTNNQVNTTLTSQTSFTVVSGYFRTPKNLPANQWLRLRLSTALTNTINLFINYVAMAKATQCYTAGPYVCVFREATDPVIGDSYSVTVSNNYGGVMQTAFWRNFNMPVLGLQLPSASTGSVGGGAVNVDTLVTC